MLDKKLTFDELEKLSEGADKSYSNTSDSDSGSRCIITSNPLPPREVEIKASDAKTLSVPSGNSAPKSAADLAAEASYLTDKILLDDKNAKELHSKTLMFDNYIDLLSFFSEAIRKDEILLHLWQIKTGKLLCETPASIASPLKAAICASNGSGKDSFCIAPLAVWFILCKLKSRVVITSSSGVQLTAQTETYIRNLCETINSFMTEQLGQPKAFKINQRYIRCLYTGSEIRMYATDEPGKAEGYHPMEPNAPFLLIVNEAKSVLEEIFGAISRCTGFSHKVYVSSPGQPKGSFYYAFNNWPISLRVTSYDCTHIPRTEIEADKLELGEHSALFRSKHLALFTSIDGQVVISEDDMTKCRVLCKTHIGASWPKRVGIDLAAGGDECVVAICQGNKRINQLTFVEKDTTITADIINNYLVKHGIPKDSDHIRADDGGVGRGIIDQLVRMGWSIRRVLNQSPALDKRMYGNRGAEMWFRFSRIIQESLFLFPDDDKKLIDQLTARHYRQSSGGSNRLFLQDKKEAKAEGYPSPDRADALVLANSDLTVETFLKEEITPAEKKTQTGHLTVEELVEAHDKIKHGFKREPVNQHFTNAHLVNWADSAFQEPKTTNNNAGSTSLSCLLGI